MSLVSRWPYLLYLLHSILFTPVSDLMIADRVSKVASCVKLFSMKPEVWHLLLMQVAMSSIPGMGPNCISRCGPFICFIQYF